MTCLACESECAEMDVKEWVVVKLAVAKKRGFAVTSGQVIVRGWGMQEIDRVQTEVCADCMTKKVSEAAADRRLALVRYQQRQKILNVGGPALGAVIFGAAYFLGPEGIEAIGLPKRWHDYAIVVAVVAAILPVLHFFLDPKLDGKGDGSEKYAERMREDVGDAFHREFVETMREGISKRLGEDVKGFVLHPEPVLPEPEPVKGMCFMVPAKAIAGYQKHQEKTGWSRIDYYHKGADVSGEYDRGLQRQNLRNFGFEHWGEFLSKPAEELAKVIDGYADDGQD
ncbi:hypothetical protein [Poriferisphaera sp. WC338]|uniref:hypothetical protein n=1 Tax=Poriferisphaera sp. WC338 TaxID=3425129 RepID=UPI003D81C0E1